MRSKAKSAVSVTRWDLVPATPIRNLARRPLKWQLALLVLCIAGASGLVSAAQPTAPEAAPARVTFVRLQPPTGAEVLIDDHSFGKVDKGAYMEVELVPGFHLASGRWANFRSGRSYSMMWTTEGWILDMVGEEPIATAVASLERVSPDEQDVSEAQQQRNRRKYEKAARKAPTPASPSPPIRLTGVRYRQEFPKKVGGLLADHFKGGFGKQSLAGTLVVDNETLRFELNGATTEIPVNAISSFRFRGWLPSTPDPWLQVLHGDLEAPSSEFFSSDAYEVLFDALVQVTGHG